ncbi:hypothetical protein AVEN_270622-1 [Araneus ventricosus]|uniref:Uncharacterized protein n=1 Tax=Araneus ventricosus TaxID=182803 RepID=A0A4Y2DIU8_ARAVE|nr:hypothetical protein AVEN_270622-1 [Araneus ventricosus]
MLHNVFGNAPSDSFRKSSLRAEQEIAEDDAFEVLHCDDKAPTECQLTDAEICSVVLMNSQTSVSDSEDSKGETQVEDKIPNDSLMEVLNTE